jgi:hypothetical protein
MSTFPLARRDPRDAAQDNRAAALKRSLFNALKGLDPALLQRGLAGLTGDTRRKALLSRQIAEFIDRLKSEDVEKALSRPLGEAYREGFGKGGRDARGPSSEVALDRDKLRSLTRALTDPLTDALHRAKSPLPYVLPRLVQADQREAFIGAAMEASARGLTSQQFAKLLRERGQFDLQTIKTADGGPFVTFPNGYRMGAGRYVDSVARTTVYWSSNRGVLDRCAEDEIELVEIVENPGTIDFCLELEGRVFALTDEAAKKAGVPLLADCPGGGPPFHPNCRHSLSPYVWIPGEKLPAADPSVMTGKASTAQHEFLKKLDADPMKFARQISESASMRTFGEREVRLKGKDAALAGQPIPGLVAKKETFGPKNALALSEDVHLAKRMKDSDITTRAGLRIRIADVLRESAGDPARAFAGKDGHLYYHDASRDWTVVVEPRTGLVITGYPMNETWAKLRARKER